MRRLDVRIDDRLLHSEVIYGCLPAFGTTHVIVATDLPARRAVDPLALPAEVDCQVVTPAQSAAAINARSPDSGPLLLVVGTPEEARSAWLAGVRPPCFVLANRARREGTIALADTYFVDAEERAALRALRDAGASLVLQRVPTDEPRALGEAGLAAAEDQTS